MEQTGQHPLSIYFQTEEEGPDTQQSPPQPMINSPQSFGFDRGDPLSVNTDPEYSNSSAAINSGRENEYGMQTILGSIEQSPHGQRQDPYGKVYRANQSYGLSKNAYSSLDSQFASSQDGAQDDYRFLGGIREVDDDEETLGGQRSASGAKSSNGKSFGGTFKGSRGSANGSGLAEDAKLENYYGTLPPVNDSATNPFIHNLQQQALWSSGKSSSGEFGGGGFGTFSEPNLNPNRNSPSQDPESQRIDYYNRNLLTKVYNQALAQMGEKACMRFAMKEVVLILDDLNQTMCKQSVHQEIIMSEETGTQQMRQIMDLSLREQKSSAKRRHDRSVDSEEKLDSKTKELLEGLKKKSNLQLIEMLRMDSKMMQIRFGEFMGKEGKIYNLYAKERERNEMLQNELLKYENNSSERKVFPNRSPQAFKNMESYSMSYQKDTIEKAASNNNITVNQLSPVSAFVKNQQHKKSQQEDVIQEVNQSIEEESDLRNKFLKLLDEKDKEIIMLNDYVDNLKREFQSLKQPELGALNLLQNERNLRSESSSNDLRSTLEVQQDKMIQLHTSIQHLRRQNSLQDNQLHQGISVQTAPIKHEEIIKLEEELSQLKHEMNETRRVKLSSSPSKKQGGGSSYENTGATRAAHQRRVIEEERKQHSRSVSGSKQTNNMIIGGQTMEYFSEPNSSNQTRRIPGQQQHISEPQISVSTQQDIRNIQMMADTLNVKLKEVLIKNHDLQLKEKQLTEKIQNREFEYAELRVLTRDLQAQAQVNFEALDKAGKVIQKLNQDLQKGLDAAAQIQNECERLKQDGRFNKRTLQEMDQKLQNQEEANEAKIQRIDNELNLEINQLKDALGQYQNDSNQEVIDLQYHLEQLQSQLSQQKVIQHSLEAKMLADSQAFKDQLNKKKMEVLSLQDKNLSIQISMNKLETQVEQDIDVRDQVNEKQNMFLKNQINELHIKLNSKTQNQKYKNENQRNIDQDGEVIPKINESYLTTLAKEFTQQSNELQKIRVIFSSKSQDALDSFLNTHKEQFDSFKLSVLDNLIDWNQKVNELSRLANKYYDTLEEYKMLFVQMKQVIKEKDLMVRNMRNHSLSVQQIQEEKYGQMNCSLLDSNFDTLANLKNMTKVLENKIKVKEIEVEELLKYQEDFRQEYLRTCEEKEGLFRDNQQLSSKVEYLDRDLQNRKKIDHEYKEKLRTTLGIQEGPHQYDVVVQHVESVVEISKAQKLQIRHYQEKCEEITLEIENQRGIFHLKMSDMEKQLEDSQKQFIDQQDDAQLSFLNKEQDFDKIISQLTTDLEKAEHEIQLRERQIRKHETKVEDEIEKQRQLQINIEELIQEQNRLKEINVAFKETCEIVQDKLQETQEHLDSKVTRVDQLDIELKQAYNRVDKLEVNLYNSDNENKEKSTHFDQLVFKTTSDIATLQIQSKKLRELEDLTKHLSAQMDQARQSEKILASENLQQKQQLREMNTQSQTINYQSEEIKQLDEQTLAQLDTQILKKEKQHLEDEVEENKAYINKYIHYSRASMACQTDDSGMVELDMMGQEVYNLRAHVKQVLKEQEQLREAMRRQMNDIDRLIEEKRHLEKQIDQKNTKIYNLQQKESTYASENVDITNHQRHRSNSPDNSGVSQKIGQFASRNNFDMVLSEKQSYINNLEMELNDLRVENEKLKDKVIVYEMENLGGKSMGQTNNFNERTLAESQVQPGTRYSAENYRIGKNYTQKVGFNERPPRFEKTQQHVNRGGAPQSSFDRSLNFGLTSFQSSHYIPDNQRPPMRQSVRPEYYTLNQSENEEQMTPYLIATETDVSQRTDSPMRVAAQRYPNVQYQ